MLRRLALLAMLCSVCTLSVRAEDIFAVTTDSKLIRFDSAAPGTIISTVTITGLQSGEVIHGIDFRPIDGKLYALGSTSRLYIINTSTGAATQVGTGQFSTLLAGNKFGFDFNPNADRIRVVSDTAQNLRLNPDTGAFVAADPTPVFVTNGLSGTAALTGAAYSNNIPAAPTGSFNLFVIDSTKDSLFVQDLTTHGLVLVGSLGVDVADTVGFDISGQSGSAFAALSITGQSAPVLCSINLFNGSATPLGAIGTTSALVGIAAPTAPVQIGYSVNGTNLRPFLLNAPDNAAGPNVAITGLTGGHGIVGIDFRPATGQLYAMTSNGTAFRLYTIDLASGTSQGAVTQVGADFVLPNTPGGTYDIDFNPTVDRIRVVTSTGTDARLHPDTGVVVAIDGNLLYSATDPTNPGETPIIVAAAYLNNFAGATTTTLYDLDALGSNNTLVTQSPPNAGTLNTVGTLQTNGNPPTTVTVGVNAGFDIAPDGRAFATLNGRFYQINLASGVAIQLGSNAGILGSNISEFAIPTNGTAAVGSPGAVSFAAASTQVVEGNVGSIMLTRTGGSTGLVSVFVTTSGNATVNSATPNLDYTPIGLTVTFADGETSRTVAFEALTDSTLELFETVQLTISNPVGCAVGTQSSTTIIIVDIDDSDGDGFTNAEELAAGTNPNDASSTPFGGAPAGASDTTNLTVTKAMVKLNFTKAASDTITIGADLAGFTVTDLSTLSGQKFVVNLGGVTKSMTLLTKGSSDKKADKNNSVKIGKPKNSVSKISISLKKGDFAAALEDDGLGDDDDSPTKAARSVGLRVLFNGKRYDETVPLITTIKSGKSSTSTMPKNR